MKRKLLTLAIGSVVATQAGVVLADATVYGKLNLSAQQQTFDYYGSDFNPLNGQKDKATSVDQDEWVLNTNTSRLGFKGKNKITDDLDAVFKIEVEVVADTGTADGTSTGSPFKSRNIVGGLSSKKWGTIQAGKNDTALKMMADGTDQFNDLVIGDIANYMVGENRQSNIIMYTSPTFFDGLTITFTDELSEDSGVGTNYSKNDETSFVDRYSAAAKYAFGDQGFIGLAADHNIKNTDIVRLVGSATLGDFTFGAHIQEAEVSDNDLDNDGIKGEIGEGIGGNTGLESSFGNALGNAKIDATGAALPATSMYYKDIKSQDAWMINGKYQLGNWAFKAQYGESSADSAVNSILKTKHTFDAEQIALGVDYSLSKNTTVYFYASELDFNADNVDFVAGNGNGLPSNNDDSNLRTAGLGFETKF